MNGRAPAEGEVLPLFSVILPARRCGKTAWHRLAYDRALRVPQPGLTRRQREFFAAVAGIGPHGWFDARPIAALEGALQLVAVSGAAKVQANSRHRHSARYRLTAQGRDCAWCAAQIVKGAR